MARTPRYIGTKENIVIEEDYKKTEGPEIGVDVGTDTPQALAVQRVHEVMRLNTAATEVAFNAALAPLVDDLGIEFVSEHFCEQAAEGGERCPQGECELGEYCTCQEGMHQYIEDFIGFRIEK